MSSYGALNWLRRILPAGSVTNAELANMAQATIKGRASGAGTGDPQDLTANQASTILDGATDPFLRTSAASGGTTNVGSTTVDFGAFPGKSDASATITGQAGILVGSKVDAWIVATATADHTADEHWVETIQVTAGNIVAGTGFTIYARNTNQINEPGPVIQDRLSQTAALAKGGPGRSLETLDPHPEGTRLYGAFTVHWQWI